MRQIRKKNEQARQWYQDNTPHHKQKVQEHYKEHKSDILLNRAKKKDIMFQNEGEKLRYIAFKKELRDILSYFCLCCNRMLSGNGAKKIKSVEDYRSKVNSGESKDLFEQSIKLPLNDALTKGDAFYICKQCDQYLLCKRRMPPLSVLNGMGCEEVSAALELNDLEQILISKSILFLRLMTLPKSNWVGVKSKTVFVPLQSNDVLETLNKVSSLPRRADNAGMVPVALMRKVSYNHSVIKANINPSKLLVAIR